MKLVQSTLPVRVQQDGRWVPADTDLHDDGRWLSPKATVAPVQFSDGGDDVLAKVRTSTGQWVSESWPDGGALPKPHVDGSEATYQDVLPGVDLKLNATATGMSEVLVVKSADAAADPALQSIELALHGASVSENDTHATAESPDGSKLTSAKPTWWDASHDGDADGPGGASVPQPLPHSSDSDSVTLDVGQVATGDVQYPLYVDPDWSSGQQNFWFTDRAYPSQSYLNGSPAGYQSVGYAQQSGTTYLSRAFWEFNIGALAGKHIVGAQFGAIATYSCSAVPVEAWRYGPANPGFTWNSDPNQWVDHLDTQNFASTGGCGISPTSVGWNVTRGVSDVAGARGSTIQIGLRSGDEGSISRKHFNNNATLTVSYNTAPNRPSGLQMTSPQRSCSTDSANPAYVNNRAQALTFQLTASDPDPQNVQSMFALAPAGNLGATIQTFNTAAGSQGTQSATLAKGTLNNNAPTAYAYRAITTDGTDYGPWSSWCYFTTKNLGPSLPSVTTSATSSTIGKATPVTVSYPATDAVRSIAYWWTATAKTNPAPVPPATIAPTSDSSCSAIAGQVTIICASSPTTTTLSVAPVDTTSTLWVATYDKAGNVSVDAAGKSASTGLEFDNVINDPAVDLHSGHAWMLDSDTTTPTTVEDTNTASGSGIASTAPLSIGSNTTATTTGETFHGPTSTGANALDLNSNHPLISINRLTGTHHYAVINGGPNGLHFESNLGDLLSPGQPASSSTTMLYSCDRSSDNMTSKSAGCENTGVTGTPLGYAWNSAAAVPSPLVAVAVYRCWSGADHFDSTSSNCEGRTSEGLLGYFAVQTVNKTTHPVVDTTKSFTASMWLNPTEWSDKHHAYTAMAQNGSANFAFQMKLEGSTLRSCVETEDKSSAGCATAPLSLSASNADNWTFVATEYDRVNHQIRLYVNGNLATGANAVQPFTLPTSEAAPVGSFTIGAGNYNGATGDLFDGQIVDPVVVPGIVSNAQMAAIRDSGSFNGGF